MSSSSRGGRSVFAGIQRSSFPAKFGGVVEPKSPCLRDVLFPGWRRRGGSHPGRGASGAGIAVREQRVEGFQNHHVQVRVGVSIVDLAFHLVDRVLRVAVIRP